IGFDRVADRMRNLPEGAVERAQPVDDSRFRVNVEWRSEALRKLRQPDLIAAQHRPQWAPEHPLFRLAIGEGRRLCCAVGRAAAHLLFAGLSLTLIATTV